jgi:sugar/nucleoside kinase (ribokinase family)
MKEAQAVDPQFRLGDDPKAAPPAAFDRLREALGIDDIVIKLGEHGALALVGGRVWPSDAAKVSVVDTCGAGDAFLAALSLAGLARPDLALTVANRWAGLSTTVHGTVPPKKSDLLSWKER